MAGHSGCRPGRLEGTWGLSFSPLGVPFLPVPHVHLARSHPRHRGLGEKAQKLWVAVSTDREARVLGLRRLEGA